MERLVLLEAFAEVNDAMRSGVSFPTLEDQITNIPFTQLPRSEKVELLNTSIDWCLYSHFDLRPEQAWRIVENASDGRPQREWLDPVLTRHQHSAQPCLSELMKRCAITEQHCKTVIYYERER